MFSFSFHFQAMQCGYIMLLMAAFWVTEALPLAVTSLIPVVLLPLFGTSKLKHILTLKLQNKNIKES
jgi:sodium-dependent dicarboxylate transporter 2/3/5